MAKTPNPEHQYWKDGVLWQEDFDLCETCNMGGHTCPGCGDNTPHAKPVHVECAYRLDGDD